MKLAIDAAERGLVPDAALRAGIRSLLKSTLREQGRGAPEGPRNRARKFIAHMRQAPVALHTQDANRQHYEVPPAFFLEALGPRLKYSSCFYRPGVDDLGAAEEAMLELSCKRAQLRDGQAILELGCGWGSLTLWMAEKYPNAQILAVSNSNPQREHIMARAAERGLANIRVRTCDMNEFDPGAAFDRIVSVEMFEHMRNWDELFRRCASWLLPGGRMFLHVFSHRDFLYPYETEGEENWMGRYFFTGGIMPSDWLPYVFSRDLRIEDHWRVCGTHYSKTALGWLENIDAKRERVEAILGDAYGPAEAARWRNRWRMFFLACAELWGWDQGREWFVSHYRLKRADEDA